VILCARVLILDLFMTQTVYKYTPQASIKNVYASVYKSTSRLNSYCVITATGTQIFRKRYSAARDFVRNHWAYDKIIVPTSCNVHDHDDIIIIIRVTMIQTWCGNHTHISMVIFHYQCSNLGWGQKRKTIYDISVLQQISIINIITIIGTYILLMTLEFNTLTTKLNSTKLYILILLQITNAFSKNCANYTCIYFGSTLVQIDYSHTVKYYSFSYYHKSIYPKYLLVRLGGILTPLYPTLVIITISF